MSNERIRLSDIDALRAIAVLSVLFFHASNTVATYPTNLLIRYVGGYGQFGVDIFFIISGFILPYVMFISGYKLKNHWKAFLLKRIVRIEPAYLASILLSVVLGLIVNWFYDKNIYSYSLPQLFAHFLYLNTFLGFTWVNPVFWTLAIEFQFYLVLMLVYPLLMFKWGRLGVLIAGSLLSSAFPASSTILHFLPLFLFGIGTFLCYSGVMNIFWYLLWLAVTCISCNAAIGLLPVVIGLCTSVFILVLKKIRINWNKHLLFCGSISYSIYLIHYPVVEKLMRISQHLGYSLIAQVLALIGSMAVAVAMSWAFYLLVEKPSMVVASDIKYK